MMTAAHQHRAALELVPDPDDTVTGAPTEDLDDWRAQSVIDKYSPEHQFVGSLMWLSVDAAQPLLDLVPDTAIWRPQTRCDDVRHERAVRVGEVVVAGGAGVGGDGQLVHGGLLEVVMAGGLG